MSPSDTPTHLPSPAHLAIITSLVRAEQALSGRGNKRSCGPFVALGALRSSGEWRWSAAPELTARALSQRRVVALPAGSDAIGMVSAGSAQATAPGEATVPVVVAWACMNCDDDGEPDAVSLVLFTDGTALWSAPPSGALPTAASVSLRSG